MWVVGFFMQSLGIVLYYQKGLYADCGMEFYYLAMTVYGFIAWMRHKQKAKDLPIRHIPKKMALLWVQSLVDTIMDVSGISLMIY